MVLEWLNKKYNLLHNQTHLTSTKGTNSMPSITQSNLAHKC